MPALGQILSGGAAAIVAGIPQAALASDFTPPAPPAASRPKASDQQRKKSKKKKKKRKGRKKASNKKMVAAGAAGAAAAVGAQQLAGGGGAPSELAPAGAVAPNQDMPLLKKLELLLVDVKAFAGVALFGAGLWILRKNKQRSSSDEARERLNRLMPSSDFLSSLPKPGPSPTPSPTAPPAPDAVYSSQAIGKPEAPKASMVPKMPKVPKVEAPRMSVFGRKGASRPPSNLERGLRSGERRRDAFDEDSQYWSCLSTTTPC